MPHHNLPVSITPIAENIWFAQTALVNWTAIRTEHGVVLIDAGYAGHVSEVLETIAAAGGRGAEDVIAILVTHAHTDHIGCIPALIERNPEIAVLCSDKELSAVRGPEREQIRIEDMGDHLARPAFRAWLDAGIAAGGLRETSIPHARPFRREELAALGIRAIPAPGHTPGSTAYEFVGQNVLVTGDAFVTDHPSYQTPRIGAIDAHFSADDAQARATAAAIDRQATLLPGHGPLLLAPT